VSGPGDAPPLATTRSGRAGDALARTVIRARLPIFLAYVAVTLTALAALARIQFEPSYRIWFADDDPLLKRYDGFLDTFGNDDALVVVFSDPEGVFTNRALAAVKKISDRVRALPYVTRVGSLTSHQHIHGQPGDDSLVIEDLVARPLPLDPAGLAAVERGCDGDPTCRGLLASKDKKTTQILGVVDTREHSTERAFEIRAAVDKMLRELGPELPAGYELRVSGNPILETDYVLFAQQDLKKIPGLFTIFVVVVLFAAYRTVLGVVFPLLVSGTAVLVTLGAASALGIKINILTTTVPQIVLAYGLSDGVHLYSAYARWRAGGEDKDGAIALAVQRNLLPCFLSSFVTGIGFLALTVSPTAPLREIGLLAGLGVFVEYVAAFALFPTLATWSRAHPQVASTRSPRWAAIGRFTQEKPWRVVAACVALTALGALGVPRLKVNSDIIAYFKEHTPVRRTLAYINDHICATADYEFVVDTHRPEGAHDPDVLARTARLEEYLLSFPEFTNAFSIVDLLRVESRALHGEDPAWERLPARRDEAAQRLLLLSMGMPPGDDLDQWVSVDRSKIRVSTRVRHLDTRTSRDILTKVEAWARANLPAGVDVSVTGKNAMFTYVEEYISKSFIDSIAMSVVLIAGGLLLTFRSLRYALLSLAPNLGPIAILLGVMGAADIYLDFGTAMVGCIALGIAVDDTIHILSRLGPYAAALPPDEVMPTLISEIGFAMCFSSVIVIVGFSVLTLSDFRLNSNFGGLTALVLCWGLLFDLFLTPALLRLTRRRGAGRERGAP
jgi:predicted RND superfamily exporter protein